jgi:hypothetical protein
VKTPAAAVGAFERLPAVDGRSDGGIPVASLRSVTEHDPVVSGVRVGVPYQAWVVRLRAPVIFTGGPGPTPPPADTKCIDVGIYDLQISRWTESLQAC